MLAHAVSYRTSAYTIFMLVIFCCVHAGTGNSYGTDPKKQVASESKEGRSFRPSLGVSLGFNPLIRVEGVEPDEMCLDCIIDADPTGPRNRWGDGTIPPVFEKWEELGSGFPYRKPSFTLTQPKGIYAYILFVDTPRKCMRKLSLLEHRVVFLRIIPDSEYRRHPGDDLKRGMLDGRALAKFTELKGLTIDDVDWTDDDLVAISHLKNLEYLDISYYGWKAQPTYGRDSPLNPASLMRLQNMSSLKCLVAEGVEGGAIKLTKGFESLEILDLATPGRSREVNLSSITIKNLPQLRLLTLPFEGTPQIELANLPRLEVIIFRQAKGGPIDHEKMNVTIGTLPELRVLLGDFLLNDALAQNILARCPKLEHLTFRSNIVHNIMGSGTKASLRRYRAVIQENAEGGSATWQERESKRKSPRDEAERHKLDGLQNGSEVQ